MMTLLLLLAAARTSRVLYIQQIFHARAPVRNPAFFEGFYIDATEYRFRDAREPRQCALPDNCLLIDYVNMLLLIERAAAAAAFEFVYVIEDDTYFCGDSELLPKLIDANAALNVSVIYTGVGASGYAIRTNFIQPLISFSFRYSSDLRRTDRRARFGIDLVFWTMAEARNAAYRSKVHLNVHLCNGSTRNKVYGKPGCLYGVCFEYSCGKGAVNQYNVKDCKEHDLYNMRFGCARSSRGVLPVGYYGNHCLREFNKSSPV